MKTYRISYEVGGMRYSDEYLAMCDIFALQQFCHDKICDEYFDYNDIKNILIIEV